MPRIDDRLHSASACHQARFNWDHILGIVHVLLLTTESIQKQALSAKDGPVFVLDFRHLEGFPGRLEELHVCTPSLLETKVDGGRGVKLEQAPERLHQERKRRFEIYAVSGQDGVRFVFHDLFG